MTEAAGRLFAAVLLLLILVPAPLQAADQATVFIYHRFGDPRYPSTNTSLGEFRAHLETLRQGGYQVLPLTEIVARLRGGQPLPERCVAISVDDAFRSFLSGAMPLLREYGYPATLFVNTGEVNGPDYLSWEELRRSFSRRLFCQSLQKLVPEIRENDLAPGGAGVRAAPGH